MTVGAVPSQRLLWWAGGLSVGSLAVVAFPGLRALLLASDLLLLALAVVDLLITPGPTILLLKRVSPERASLLGKQTIKILVRNESGVKLLLRIRDDVAPALRPDAAELCGAAAPRAETAFSYVIYPAKRGRFRFGDLYARYRSLLGLWERVLSAPAACDIRVYPSVDEVERYHLLARMDHLQALGIRRLRVRGTSWEFESLRDFVNGDDTRLMDWKATARRNRMIVRNQQAERNQTVIILVDCGRLMTAEEQGVSKLDRAVNAALLLSHVGLSRGDRVGLCTFGAKVQAWVTPKPQMGQMRLLTEALYDLRADFSESNHARCLRQVAVRHNKRSLLVLLTDFVDAVTAEEMVAAIRHAGRRHVVLFVALRDPFIEEAARAEPESELEGYSKAVALGLLRERREVLEGLRRSGIQVADVHPKDLTPNLLNRYTEITLRGLL